MFCKSNEARAKLTTLFFECTTNTYNCNIQKNKVDRDAPIKFLWKLSIPSKKNNKKFIRIASPRYSLDWMDEVENSYKYKLIEYDPDITKRKLITV